MNIDFKSKKTWIIIAVAVLVIAIIVILVRRKKKLNVKTDDSNNLTVEGENEVLSTSATFSLRPKSLVGEYSATKGSYGKEIVILQMIHNKMCEGCTQLTVDGKYGEKTHAELKKYFSGNVADDGTITTEGYENILNMFKEVTNGTITVTPKK